MNSIRKQHWIKHSLVWLLSVLFALLCLTACGGGESIKWTEDVLLPDGRTVTLTRYQEFKGPHEIGQRPTENAYWLEFNNPDTGENIRWEYGRNLSTVTLLLYQQKPFLLLKARYGSSVHDLGCPNPTYLLFRFVGGRWEKIPLTEIPIKRLRSNMTYAVVDELADIKAGHNHLTSEQTQKSFVLNMKPWLMDFSLLKEQTYDPKNCFLKPDYWLVPRDNGDKK
jgi:hypothetical protein